MTAPGAYEEPCIYICGGPTVEVRRDPDERETRWCFACRAHLRHEWVLMEDYQPLAPFLAWDELDGYAVMEVVHSLSYYDPTWHLECTSCHRDRTWFGASKW